MPVAAAEIALLATSWLNPRRDVVNAIPDAIAVLPVVGVVSAVAVRICLTLRVCDMFKGSNRVEVQTWRGMLAPSWGPWIRNALRLGVFDTAALDLRAVAINLALYAVLLGLVRRM
jgi:hypothetical protein